MAVEVDIVLRSVARFSTVWNGMGQTLENEELSSARCQRRGNLPVSLRDCLMADGVVCEVTLQTQPDGRGDKLHATDRERKR